MRNLFFLDEEMLRLHRMVRNKSTGSPEQLAKKLGCCKRSIFLKIEKMRDNGLPVVWCPHRQSYYYSAEVSINFSIMLDGKEMQRIVGGSGYGDNDLENIFQSAK